MKTGAMFRRESGRLVEVVADADRPLLVRFSDGTESKLAVTMDIAAAVRRLSSAMPNSSLWQRFASTPRSRGVLCFSNTC